MEWKSRSLAASGPQILWTAPDSGEYYFAVHNFGGKSGPYTLTVTLVGDDPDDHGDSVATATHISAGEVIAGTVDDDFDFDYFRFQATDGQRHYVEVTGGTLEFFRVALYTSDGTTPAVMERADFEAILNRGGELVAVVDLNQTTWKDRASFEWVAPSSGEYYLVVDGRHENVGSYTLTGTQVDDG